MSKNRRTAGIIVALVLVILGSVFVYQTFQRQETLIQELTILSQDQQQQISQLGTRLNTTQD